ncbi:MAG: hypothetical protein HGA87_04220, partial [Desulfobulbaceae bacterium]|nr:hypothetical protein [Desulfobulbaceae bacterium]
PDVSERVAAYRDAARYASSGSELEQQAVAGIVKHADAIPDVSERVAAYRDAARYASSGSELEQQAVAGIAKHADAITSSPAIPSERETQAFMQKMANLGSPSL